MSPAQLISGPGAAEAVGPAANAASSLAQHSLVRALAEEIVEAALRRSGEWAGLDAAETGNAPVYQSWHRMSPATSEYGFRHLASESHPAESPF